jgi:hypothetical protein
MARKRFHSDGPRGVAEAVLEGGSGIEGAEWPVLSLSFMVSCRKSGLSVPKKLLAENTSSLFGVGVGNPKICQNMGFKAFHLKGLLISQVIITQNVQKAMHDEMGEMISEGHPLFFCFPDQSFTRERDIAQNANHRVKWFYLRKTQHIG